MIAEQAYRPAGIHQITLSGREYAVDVESGMVLRRCQLDARNPLNFVSYEVVTDPAEAERARKAVRFG